MEAGERPKRAAIHRYDERSRFNLVLVVARHMNDADFKQLVLGVHPPEQFKLGDEQRESKSKKGTIAKAVDFIDSDPDLLKALGIPQGQTQVQQRQNIENACRTWMQAWGNSERKSLAAPKRTGKGKAKNGVPVEKLQYLGKLLLNERYLDTDGNQRQFPSLEKLLQHSRDVAQDSTCSDEQRAEAAQRAANMEVIKRDATGRAKDSLDVVIKAAAKACEYVPTESALTLCAGMPMGSGFWWVPCSHPPACMRARTRTRARARARAQLCTHRPSRASSW